MSLVNQLLDFDFQDLVPEVEEPEVMLLQAACDLNGWKLAGDYPEFFVENLLQLTFTSHGEAYYRIINSRRHKHLRRLTLESLQTALKEEVAQIRGHSTDTATFLGKLAEGYALLKKDETDYVALCDIYFHMYRRNPDYTREEFGLDLNRTLAKRDLQVDGKPLTVYPSGNARQAFYVFDTANCGQYIGFLSFDD